VLAHDPTYIDCGPAVPEFLYWKQRGLAARAPARRHNHPVTPFGASQRAR